MGLKARLYVTNIVVGGERERFGKNFVHFTAYETFTPSSTFFSSEKNIARRFSNFIFPLPRKMLCYEVNIITQESF